MKRITVLAVALALVALIAMAVPALAQGPTGGNPGVGFGMMGGYGYGFAPDQVITPTVPFGMMGGRGFGFGPNQAITPTVPYGYGRGGMTLAPHASAGVGGFGMMGGVSYGYAPNAKLITLDQAITTAQSYVASFNNTDLKLVEVEEYAWNFYGVVQEKSTGTNAFQIIMDKYSGAAYPEIGPNMLWNTKYSPMAFMTLAPHASAGVGGWFNQASGKMTITLEQARANAAQYLKTNLPSATIEDTGGDTFYGYYNFDVLQNSKTYGMLSVNGYTGAVWYHTWHGDFVAAKQLD